jgi:ubiquinol-cytochrome c reductase iron-sulfur subunit
MASTAEGSQEGITQEGVRRRDWIHIAALSTAGVGGASILFPLVSQMAPTKDVLAASTTDVDISSLEPGQSVKTSFRDQPLFVKRMSEGEMEEVAAVDVSSLRDPQTLEERLGANNAEGILVQLGVCTHLGCVPLGAGEGESKGEYDGYFCPCHGSHYDAAGRIRKGPAPKNLAVPEFAFTSESTIRVG